MPIETQRRARIIVEDVPTAVACNRCSRRVEFIDPHDERQQEFHLLRIFGGPATRFPHDLTVLDFVLCFGCVEALVASFQVPPVVHHQIGSQLPREALHVSDSTPVWVTDEWVSRIRSLAQDTDNPPWTDRDRELDWPEAGVYRSESGTRVLEVVGHVLDVDNDNAPSVVFRALREDPLLWVIRLEDWNAAAMVPVQVEPENDADGSEAEQVTEMDP